MLIALISLQCKLELMPGSLDKGTSRFPHPFLYCIVSLIHGENFHRCNVCVHVLRRRSTDSCSGQEWPENMEQFSKREGQTGGEVPVIEDWHAKVCLLGVSTCPFSHANFTCNVYLCRSFGNDFTRAHREWMEGRTS